MERAPVRPPGAIDDQVWEFLEKCWSKTPFARPQMAEVHHTLKSFSKTIHIPRRQPAIGESPGVLALHFHSIKLSEDHRSQQQFYVKSKYANRDYTTSLTNVILSQYERGWSVLDPSQLPPLLLSPM